MRVLVTGGAGFIGSHLVDRLVAEGCEVAVLDNLDPQVHGSVAIFPRNLADHVITRRIDFILGDVRDRVAVCRALRGVDAVVHLAAAVGVGQSMYEPHYYASVNVAGQAMLLEQMAVEPERYRRLVVASSMSLYGEGAYRCPTHGESAPPPRSDADLAQGRWEPECPACGAALEPVLTREEKPLQHTSIYSVTKKAQEEMALCFGRAYGISTRALRFFNVYGSRQALSNPYTGVAAIFMSRLKNGGAPRLFEDGRQTRDFVHVQDVVEALVRALTAEGEECAPYNVCTGRAVSVRAVAETLAQRLGVTVAPRVEERYRSGDIRHCVGDGTRAREALGFTARVGLDEGLDELIAWSSRQDAVDNVEESVAELERLGLVW